MRYPVIALAGLGLAASAFAQHEGDFTIGRTADNALAAEGEFDQVQYLDASVFPDLDGWVMDEPGFASLDEDEPDEGFFLLDPSSSIAFRVVSFDAAFKARDPFDPFVLYENPGDDFLLGTPAFDSHLFWHIDSNDPAFDPLQSVWAVSFRFVDLAGFSAESPVYTALFAPVPAPGAWALLALAGLGAARRRR